MNKDIKHSGYHKDMGDRTVMRLCSFVIPLFLVALFIGGAVVSFANDIYAFYRPEAEAVIAVSGETGLKEFSDMLAERGIILHSAVFEVYARAKGKAEIVEAFSGEIYLSSDMGYRNILKTISDRMNKGAELGESS